MVWRLYAFMSMNTCCVASMSKVYFGEAFAS